MNENYESRDYINAARESALRKIVRKDKARLILRKAFFTPISIGLKAFSFAAKIIGGIAALGLPFGIYSCCVVIKQLANAVPLAQSSHLQYALYFALFPFIAFLVSAIAASISEYLTYKSSTIW